MQAGHLHRENGSQDGSVAKVDKEADKAAKSASKQKAKIANDVAKLARHLVTNWNAMMSAATALLAQAECGGQGQMAQNQRAGEAAGPENEEAASCFALTGERSSFELAPWNNMENMAYTEREAERNVKGVSK